VPEEDRKLNSKVNRVSRTGRFSAGLPTTCKGSVQSEKSKRGILSKLGANTECTNPYRNGKGGVGKEKEGDLVVH